MKTITVILEYCGGARTDRLFDTITRQNPDMPVFVLDNASPRDRASCVTHSNTVNSFIGGGIRDCIRLAREHGAERLFFCANDVEFLDPIDLRSFEAVMEAVPDLVQISCALTPGSGQARHFPWLKRNEGTRLREVRHADLLACMLRLDFIEGFGGFPESVSGWGYCRELAWHARRTGRRIFVNDTCTVRHAESPALRMPSGEIFDKLGEMHRIYSERYPHECVLPLSTWFPVPDEAAEAVF